MGEARSAEWWLRRIEREPDCPIIAGVPTECDSLWNIQLLAAVGIEETNDEGPLTFDPDVPVTDGIVAIAAFRRCENCGKEQLQ